MGWEELRTRLAGRRGVTLQPDQISVRTRPGVIALYGLVGLALAGFLAALYASGDMPREFSADPPAIVLTHLGAIALLVKAARSLSRPAIAVDEQSIHARGLTIPWDDVNVIEYRTVGPNLSAAAVVDERSAAVARLPRWRRWLSRRGELQKHVARGVRIGLAATAGLPLRPEELRALLAHPSHRESGPGPAPERPSWADASEAIRGRPDVEVSEGLVVVRHGDHELLRIDDAGVHGSMPRTRGTVRWEQLAGVRWLGPPRRPSAVLLLHHGERGSDLRGRRWRALRRIGQPVTAIPWDARMPFDLVTFSLLLQAHPRGEGLWRRVQDEGSE